MQFSVSLTSAEESFMSVATDTTNDENSRGDSRIAPTGGLPGVIFRVMISPVFPDPMARIVSHKVVALAYESNVDCR